jgi:uncharacterized protein (TIGR03083 family)
MTRMPSTTDNPLLDETIAERQRLVGLLAGLTPQQWSAPSLCSGWRVREVVAHMTMPFRTSPPQFIVGLAKARFSFNRYADKAARRDAENLSDERLLSSLRENVANPWRPPGGGQAGALSHDVIHGLDITAPLGLPPSPAERIALVLSYGGAKNLKYFGVDLMGRRLIATDADVELGDCGGQALQMPVAEMLLIVTGRRPLGAA